MLCTYNMITGSSRIPYILLSKSAALESCDGFVKTCILKCLRYKFKEDITAYSQLCMSAGDHLLVCYNLTFQNPHPAGSFLPPSLFLLLPPSPFSSLPPSLSPSFLYLLLILIFFLFSLFFINSFPVFQSAFIYTRWLPLNPRFSSRNLKKKNFNPFFITIFWYFLLNVQPP